MMASPSERQKHDAGFTLLEALAATVVMTVIVAALATITAQWLPNWNRGLVRIQHYEQLALGLERLSADLAAAQFIPPSRTTSQPMFDGSTHSVTFVRTALVPYAFPGLEVVRFAETGREGGLVLVRTRAPFLPLGEGAADQRNFADPVVLVRPPYRLSFSYAGADRVWRDAWRREKQLPRAIKLTLRETATQRTLAVSTATLVHAEVPAECIVAKSLAACLESRHRLPESAEAGKPRS